MKFFLLGFLLVLNTIFRVSGQSNFESVAYIKAHKIKNISQLKCSNDGTKCDILYLYNYDTSGRLFSKTEYLNSTPYYKTTYKYKNRNIPYLVNYGYANGATLQTEKNKLDKKDNIIKHYIYRKDSGILILNNYKYKNNGLLKSKKDFLSIKNIIKCKYFYNKRGIVGMKIKFHKNDSSVLHIYTYNNKWEIIKVITFNSSYLQIDSTFYEYDDRRNIVLIKQMGRQNATINYTYDLQNNLLEYKYYNNKNKLTLHHIMKYDAGLLKTTIEYVDEQISNSYIYKYDFY